MRHIGRGLLFAAIVFVAVLLLPSHDAFAYYYENLEASDETVSVYMGEKLSLYNYAPTGGTDNYRLGSGTGGATIDAQSGLVFFTKTGSLFIHDDVRDASGTLLETHTWSFKITSSSPEITKQPTSQSGYYQDSVTFTVETRQDSATLKYQWFIVHSNSMASYPRSSFEVNSWNEASLTISNLQFWMNGVRVYCMISSTTDSRLVVYTQNTPIAETPQLTVLKRPVNNVLFINDLQLPSAKTDLDFDFVLSSTSHSQDAYTLVNVSGPTYTRGGTKLTKDSRVELGDVISASFTLTLADKNNYSFPENLTVVWGDLRAEATLQTQSKAVVTFEFVVTDCNPNYLSDVQLSYTDLDSKSSILPRNVLVQNDNVEAQILSWIHNGDTYTVSIHLNTLGDFFFDDLTTVTVNGIKAEHTGAAFSQNLDVQCIYNLSSKGALILEQPVAKECYDGETVSFQVAAYFASSYQWYMIPYGSDTPYALPENAEYRGTRTDTLTIVSDIEDDLSTYYCVIDDFTTNEAVLKVHVNPNVSPWGPTEDWQDYGVRVIIYIAIALVVMSVGTWLLLRSIYGKWYLKNMKRK